jgi:hypothetical protein
MNFVDYLLLVVVALSVCAVGAGAYFVATEPQTSDYWKMGISLTGGGGAGLVATLLYYSIQAWRAG